MANDQSPLALPEDIDTRIENLVEGNERLSVETVVRDIARIHTIVRLVRQGWLDGTTAVLCGGMAMRCLDGPRFTFMDTDTSRKEEPDREVLSSAIATDDDDLLLTPAATDQWKDSRDLVTAQPLNYDPRFTLLDPGNSTFTLSVAWRGLERDALWLPIKHGYPFEILADPDLKIPIMDPNEMLAEKLCGWWIFSNAKHYNDIAFLGGRLADLGEIAKDETREEVLGLVETKLAINRKTSAMIRERVDALTSAARTGALRNPAAHVDKKWPGPRGGVDTASVLI